MTTLPECEKLHEDLIDLVEEVLASDRNDPVQAHLRDCENCRNFLSDLRFIRRTVREDIPDPGEEYFQALSVRIMDRIKSGEADPWWMRARRWFGGSLLRPAAALAPVAAALVLAFLVFGRPLTNDLPESDEDISRIAQEVRFFSPMRQLNLVVADPQALSVPDALDDKDEENMAVAVFHHIDDDSDLAGAIQEIRGLAAVPTGFAAPGAEMTEKDASDFKDYVDEKADSWSI